MRGAHRRASSARWRAPCGSHLPLDVRPHAAPRGPAPGLQVDLPDLRRRRPPSASSSAAWTSSTWTTSASRPTPWRAPISDAKNQSAGPGRSSASSTGGHFSAPRPTCTSSTRRSSCEMSAMDFDDLLMKTVNCWSSIPDRLAHYQRAFRFVSSTSTRTPTTPSTGSPTCWPASAATWRWSATTTSASTRGAAPTSATSSSSSATTPTRGHPPGAELPLDAAHPRRGQRGGHATTAAQGQEPVDGARHGPPAQVVEVNDEHAEAQFVASEVQQAPGRGREGPARSGRLPRRDDIAVLYRTNAQCACSRSSSDATPSPTRSSAGTQLLRARRDQGRARLPRDHSTTRPTSSGCCASSTCRSRGIGADRLSACRPRRRPWARPVAARSSGAGDVPGLTPAAVRGAGGLRGPW